MSTGQKQGLINRTFSPSGLLVEKCSLGFGFLLLYPSRGGIWECCSRLVVFKGILENRSNSIASPVQGKNPHFAFLSWWWWEGANEMRIAMLRWRSISCYLLSVWFRHCVREVSCHTIIFSSPYLTPTFSFISSDIFSTCFCKLLLGCIYSYFFLSEGFL